mmetsp:Transcript_7786/g.23821  ORF Transcript_7786/g.23821 Transcript_7786/m.23821 type:complete len:240 (-) Transcript_7786:1394-2113(-)
MRKSSSAVRAMPSRVVSERSTSVKYGGRRKRKRSATWISTAATGPKRSGIPTSPAALPEPSPSSPELSAPSPPVPSASSRARATSARSAQGGSTSMAAKSSVSGPQSALAMCASAASIARLWSRRILHSSPKSRYASVPAGVSSRLPGWGSACSRPVSSSCTRLAATPMLIMPMSLLVASSVRSGLAASRPMSRIVSPSIHSIVSTRSALRPSRGSGTVTKARWRCASAKALPLAASRR